MPTINRGNILDKQKRIVIGITGASGAPIAIELLKALTMVPEIETHLIISDSAIRTVEQETDDSVESVKALADVVYDVGNIGATIASGSFKNEGMIIVPCSMKTLAGIANGYSDNLIQRAADVAIKEKRKLLLVPRECPLSPIHLKNMLELSQLGVMMLPPVLSYYNHPKTIEDSTRHIVGKILDAFGIEYSHYKRWEG